MKRSKIYEIFFIFFFIIALGTPICIIVSTPVLEYRYLTPVGELLTFGGMVMFFLFGLAMNLQEDKEKSG